MVTIKTGPCVVCKQPGEVEVTESEYAAYAAKSGPLQSILSRLSDGDREMLISGTHSDCFDSLFPPEEDEEDDNYLPF